MYSVFQYGIFVEAKALCEGVNEQKQLTLIYFTRRRECPPRLPLKDLNPTLCEDFTDWVTRSRYGQYKSKMCSEAMGMQEKR